mmetsp:Transcript_27740/g.111097  ORF Transcript_27740/g.111097 Transcript_27740/m.111097 type:complete len:219 (-) Transcript_27740:198-854(-)
MMPTRPKSQPTSRDRVLPNEARGRRHPTVQLKRVGGDRLLLRAPRGTVHTTRRPTSLDCRGEELASGWRQSMPARCRGAWSRGAASAEAAFRPWAAAARSPSPGDRGARIGATNQETPRPHRAAAAAAAQNHCRGRSARRPRSEHHGASSSEALRRDLRRRRTPRPPRRRARARRSSRAGAPDRRVGPGLVARSSTPLSTRRTSATRRTRARRRRASA